VTDRYEGDDALVDWPAKAWAIVKASLVSEELHSSPARQEKAGFYRAGENMFVILGPIGDQRLTHYREDCPRGSPVTLLTQPLLLRGCVNRWVANVSTAGKETPQPLRGSPSTKGFHLLTKPPNP
jgi:hypothetical protein